MERKLTNTFFFKMDELQQNIVGLQKDLTSSMFEIKIIISNYLTIHMFKHKESLFSKNTDVLTVFCTLFESLTSNTAEIRG